MLSEPQYMFAGEEFTQQDEDGEIKSYAVCSICGRATESDAGIKLSYDSGYDEDTGDMGFFFTGSYCWCEKCKAEIGEKIHGHVIDIIHTLETSYKEHEAERARNREELPKHDEEAMMKAFMETFYGVSPDELT